MPKLYARLDTQLWSDPNFRQLSDDAKLVYYFLLGHENLTMLGTMRTALMVSLAAEMEFELARFRAAFSSLLEEGFFRYDEQFRFLSMPGYVAKNKPANKNVAKHWEKLFKALPDCSLKDSLAEEIMAVRAELPDHFKEFANSFETVSEEFGNSFETDSNYSNSNSKQYSEAEAEAEPEKTVAPLKNDNLKLSASSKNKIKQPNGDANAITSADIPTDDEENNASADPFADPRDDENVPF